MENLNASTTAAPGDAEVAGPALWFAHLDSDGTYLGQEQFAYGSYPADVNKLELGATPCDLSPGRYKWDAEKKHFYPVIEQKPAAEPLDVSATNVLARLIRDLDAAKVPLSAPVKAWLASYSRTVDFN